MQSAGNKGGLAAGCRQHNCHRGVEGTRPLPHLAAALAVCRAGAFPEGVIAALRPRMRHISQCHLGRGQSAAQHIPAALLLRAQIAACLALTSPVSDSKTTSSSCSASAAAGARLCLFCWSEDASASFSQTITISLSGEPRFLPRSMHSSSESPVRSTHSGGILLLPSYSWLAEEKPRGPATDQTMPGRLRRNE